MLASPASGGEPLPPTAGPVYLGLAEVAYQRNELDRALRYVSEGIALSRQFRYGPSPAPGWVTLAWIRQAAGDPARALEAIGEAEQASPVPAGLLYPAPAQRARLLLALAACGQDADAVNALADVLTLACPQGYVRVFADEGPPMAALLARLMRAEAGRPGRSPPRLPAPTPARL